jgi:pimeloyl-ACP methyl ester carboxylesterase
MTTPIPTLMLLPGLMCDAAVWTPLLPALQAHAECHVVAYGLRNSLTTMAQQVLDEAPTERFALAGHSMGGRVAMEVMRLAPHRVERLALLDTGTHTLAAGDAGERERAGRMVMLEQARTQGMRAMGQSWAKGMVHPSRLDTPVFEDILQMLERSNPAQFEAQQTALLGRRDATPQLPTLQCPTLILCGRQDGWSPPGQHQVMYRALGHLGEQATLRIIENCGHMCTMEQPQAVGEALVELLRG